MAFLELPNELLIQVAEHLDNDRDIASMVRVNKHFHQLFDRHLYRRNAKSLSKHSALLWAAMNNRRSTALKALHWGANVNSRSRRHATPLHIAALNGHLNMVKLLLRNGADTEAKNGKAVSPLYAALSRGHEEVAHVISKHIGDLNEHLVDSKRNTTPLHMACHQALWRCVRFFLKNGAKVDAGDADGRTPLHHILQTEFHNPVCLSIPPVGPTLKTIKALLEYGADQSLTTPWMFGREGHVTAFELGANHTYKEVRNLFPTPMPKPQTIDYGREVLYFGLPSLLLDVEI